MRDSINTSAQFADLINKQSSVGLPVVKGAVLTVYTQVMSPMTCCYFQSINKEYISTRQIFFINQLTAISAVYYNANVTILGETAHN